MEGVSLGEYLVVVGGNPAITVNRTSRRTSYLGLGLRVAEITGFCIRHPPSLQHWFAPNLLLPMVSANCLR
jgi:hypothetical protein